MSLCCLWHFQYSLRVEIIVSGTIFCLYAALATKYSFEGPAPTPEKAMAPHSSTLAWKIPWTEEPGRLQSMGSIGVRHDCRLHFHFSLSCTGEGNGNPLQYSCLENPRDGGAWWAAVYGVAQSQTRLKQLSSSSSSSSSSNSPQPPPPPVPHACSVLSVLFATPWTVSCQASLSIEFPRQ